MPSLSLSLNHAGKFVPVTEQEKHQDELQKAAKSLSGPIDLNNPGVIKDLGSVNNPVGEILDLGDIK